MKKWEQEKGGEVKNTKLMQIVTRTEQREEICQEEDDEEVEEVGEVEEAEEEEIRQDTKSILRTAQKEQRCQKICEKEEEGEEEKYKGQTV